MILILKNYNPDTLLYGLPSRKMALFGSIASAAIGAAGVGLNAGAQFQANAQNEELTREGWALQQEEAEKSRQFNSEEAAKSRDYYNELSVLERRQQAGLNVAMTGSESASTGASASSSPGSISSPTPMKAVDAFSQLGPIVAEALGIYNNTRNADSDVRKKLAELRGINLDNALKEATNNISVDIQNQTLENLKKTGEIMDLQSEQVRQAISIERQHANQARLVAWYQWRNSKREEFNTMREGIKTMSDIENFNRSFFEMQRNFAQSLRREYKDMAYKYGKRVTDASNENTSYSSAWSNLKGTVKSIAGSLTTSGQVEAGVPGFGKVTGKVETSINGQYQSNSQQSNGFTDTSSLGMSTQSSYTIEDDALAQISAEVIAICDEYDKGGHTKEYVNFLIDKLMNLNLSFDMYLFDLEQSQSERSINAHNRQIPILPN